MKKTILVAAVLLVAAAFADDTLWVRQYQQGQEAGGYACATSGSDVYVAGNVRVSPTPDILVLKYTSSGDTVWSRTYDIDTMETTLDIAVGSDGKPVVLARVDADPMRASIVKLNSNGDTAWVRRLTDVFPTNMSIGISDAVYVWGASMESIPFGGFMLAKYDAAGTFAWKKTIRLGQDHQPGGCCADRSGNILAVGTALDSVGPHHYVVKYNANGDTLWARQYPQMTAQNMLGVTADRNNNVVATAIEGQNLKVMKCDSMGTQLWSYASPENLANDCRNALATDSNGNIVVPRKLPGEFLGLLIFTPSGSISWQTQVQFQGTPYAVTVGPDNCPVMAGRTSMGVPACITIKFINGAGIKGQGLAPNRPGTGMCRTSIVGPDARVRLEIPASGEYSASLYSASGERVSSFEPATLTQGVHSLSLAGAPAGAYLLQIAGPAGAELARIVRVR